MSEGGGTPRTQGGGVFPLQRATTHLWAPLLESWAVGIFPRHPSPCRCCSQKLYLSFLSNTKTVPRGPWETVAPPSARRLQGTGRGFLARLPHVSQRTQLTALGSTPIPLPVWGEDYMVGFFSLGDLPSLCLFFLSSFLSISHPGTHPPPSS